MSDPQKIRVVFQPSGTGQVYLDDVRLENVRSVTVKGEGGEPAAVTVEFCNHLDVSVEVEDVVNVTPLDAKNGFRQFRSVKAELEEVADEPKD